MTKITQERIDNLSRVLSTMTQEQQGSKVGRFMKGLRQFLMESEHIKNPFPNTIQSFTERTTNGSWSN